MAGLDLDIWVVVALAVAAGQLLKLLLYSIAQRELRLSVLGQSAGLPSLHAACGGSLIGACVMRMGWTSLTSGVALVFAAITVHDAMRVRAAAYAQRRVLRDLMRIDPTASRWRRRVVGYLDATVHTPSHVAVGLIWGFLFALACGAP